jgi:hypothetical protein
MKNKFLFPILFLLILLVSSCSTKINRKKIIVLIDYSGSVKEDVFKKYEDNIAKAFMSLSANDCFSVYPIDMASVYKNSVIFSLDEGDLSETKFAKRDDGNFVQDSIKIRISAYLDSQKQLLLNALDYNYSYRTKQNNLGQGTDLLGAFEQLNQVIITDKSKKWYEELVDLEDNFISTNYIIIFSDMLNDTKEYNFNHWTTEGSQAVIQTLDELNIKKRLLSDIAQANVFIYGPTVYTDNIALFHNVEYFWHEYFKRRGATVVDYNCDDPKMQKFYDTLNEKK